MRIRSIAAAAAATALLAAAIPTPVEADMAHATLPGIRPLGMGNAFVAVGGDRNTLHYNPAGLQTLKNTRISGLGIFGGIDNQFFEVIQFIQDNEENFSDFDNIDQEFYDSLAPFDDSWVAADANAYMDFTRPNFGVGLYTTGRVQFKIDRGVYEPRVSANVFDDIVGVVGGSMDLGRYDITVGANAKMIFRRESTRDLKASEVADFNPDEVLDDLASAESGFAMDLGMMWQPQNANYRAGAVLRDAPGVVGSESIGAAFDMGGAWWPLSDRGGVFGDLMVALDLRDTFGDGAWGNKVHMGAELPLPIVAVRAGFNQGYPTAGLSIGSRILSVDYAFFGRELGEFPGAESQFLHAVEARLGF